MSFPPPKYPFYILGIYSDSPRQPCLLVRQTFDHAADGYKKGEESFDPDFNGVLPDRAAGTEAVPFADKEAALAYIQEAITVHQSDWTYALWSPPFLPKDPDPVMLKRHQVVQEESGRKYVVREPHLLPNGALIVCDLPHEDGDFSYTCNSEYCRCTQ